MNPLVWTVAQFLFCAALILISGVRLSRYGDIIAEKTGVGETWMGLVVIAAVTSLPELITGASSMVVFDVPDIGAGDAIGSCLFNLVILAWLDARSPVPLAARVHQGHVLSAAFGILLLGIAALGMLTGTHAPRIGWFGFHSLILLGVYALAMRTVSEFERGRLARLTPAEAAGNQYEHASLRRTLVLFAANAVVLVGAAAYLPALGERLAFQSGLHQSFVGSLFVAASTSLPEIVVSAAAARIGAIDMAAANLFGSNLFNLAVLGLNDLLYTPGPLMTAIAPSHLVTLTTAILMTAVAIISLTYRSSRKRYRLGWDTLTILALYAAATALLHRLG